MVRLNLNEILLTVFVQAQAAENADTVKSQGKPGFLSQMFSEITAPLYDNDEEENFYADDNSDESFIKVGENLMQAGTVH